MAISRRAFLGAATAAVCSLPTRPIWAAPTIAEQIAVVPETHPFLPAMKMAAEAYEAVSRLEGYEATFIKNELIGRQMLSSQCTVKVRHNPFSVYMKYVTPHEGREVIYVDGQNNGNMLAHETGFASLIGTVTVAPTDRRALDENRYPITSFGMKNMAHGVLVALLGDKTGEGGTVNLFPKAKIGDVACRAIEMSYAKPAPGRMFQSCRLYLEATTSLPIRIQNYTFPQRRNEAPQLVEDYFYTAVKTNVALVAQDFDVNNPRYNY